MDETIRQEYQKIKSNF